jgi:hypothetical protein
MSMTKSQKGFASLGTMYLVLSIGFFVFLAFKVVPPYVDNMYIQEALKELAAEDTKNMSTGDIKERLKKFFKINNIRGDVTKAVKVKRAGGAIQVTIDYDKRVPMFGNIELLIPFTNHWSSANPEVCCKPVDSE